MYIISSTVTSTVAWRHGSTDGDPPVSQDHKVWNRGSQWPDLPGWEPGGEYTKTLVLKNVQLKTKKIRFKWVQLAVRLCCKISSYGLDSPLQYAQWVVCHKPSPCMHTKNIDVHSIIKYKYALVWFPYPSLTGRRGQGKQMKGLVQICNLGSSHG